METPSVERYQILLSKLPVNIVCSLSLYQNIF